jgi:hypothetical protein
MTESLSPLQLAILVGLILFAAFVILLAFRASRPGADPIIKASVKELREGLYQVGLTVTNRAPYSLVGVSLRRVRPTSARPMAPITSVRTRDGDFQVWSDPASIAAPRPFPSTWLSDRTMALTESARHSPRLTRQFGYFCRSKGNSRV